MLLFLVLALLAPLTYSEVLTDGSRSQSAFIYREQIKVIHQLLAAECPDALSIKRALPDDDLHPFGLEVQKLVYNKMFDKLMECRTRPCRSAKNLTESWRQSHNGSKLLGRGPRADSSGYACDIRRSLQWFRFTGEAGNRMQDSCVPTYSCGTLNPMWTEGDMPESIGVETEVDAHYNSNSRCDPTYKINGKLHVIRCSWDTEYDFVYKLQQSSSYSSTCFFAFCGMD